MGAALSSKKAAAAAEVPPPQPSQPPAIAKRWWTFPYPAPGKVEEHNREARQMAPDTFEGFRAEYNRQFGGGEDGPSSSSSSAAELLVTHLATVSAPKPVALGGVGGSPGEGYMLAAQFAAGPLALMGRVDRSTRRVFGTATLRPRRHQRLLERVVLQAQTHPEGGAPAELAAEVVGRPLLRSGTTHAKWQSEGGVVAVGHMQQLARDVALGAEAVAVRASGYRGLSLVARAVLPRSDAVLAALCSLRPLGLDTSYVQRLTPALRVGTELSVGRSPDSARVETAASVGWEYRAAESVLVRGKVDDRLALAVSVEENLGNAFHVSLSADLDFRRRSYLWGFGLSVSS